MLHCMACYIMQRVLHYVAYATFMLHRMTCYIVRHMVHYMAKGKQTADGTEVASQLTSRWGYYPDYLGGFNVITSILKLSQLWR